MPEIPLSPLPATCKGCGRTIDEDMTLAQSPDGTIWHAGCFDARARPRTLGSNLPKPNPESITALNTLPIFVDHKPEDTLAKTLAERGSKYGKFEDQAQIVQDLKDVMRETRNWNSLAADQKEALDMVVHKIGRILNGDPNYDDSWKDMAGYSKLIADRLAPKPVSLSVLSAADDPNAQH